MVNSQNGWPASASRNSIGVVGLVVGGIDIVGGVKDGDVKIVLGYVADQFNKRVEKLYTPGCWGHNYRPIAGSATVSNHGSGTAIDLNAPGHPRGKANTFTTSQRAAIKAILSEVDNTVTWGGSWKNPDDMHFEINCSAAKLTKVAEKIRGGTPPPTGRPTLQQGSSGPDVALVQRYLAVSPVDGVYGPGTVEAVRNYQSKQKLHVDGIVGPATWARIESGLGKSGGGGGNGGGSTSHATVRPGSTGEDVKLVQRWLGIPADGVFGVKTQEAVMRYQRMKGLSPDGIVGPQTWAAMGV